MAVAAIGLAQGMVWLDQTGAWRSDISDEVLFAENATAATTFLTVIAAALVGTLTTLFSVTLAALTFTSAQFGPRLLACFLNDRRTHVTVGALLGTLVYTLTVLRAVGNVNEPPFIPRFTISIAALLVAGSLAMILHFGKFLAELVQAPGLIASVSRDLNRSRERMYPGRLGFGIGELDPRLTPLQTDLPDAFDADAVRVTADSGGYIQYIDEPGVMRLAARHDLVLQLLCRPGEFVMHGQTLALAWPPQHVDRALCAALNEQFTLGWQRTVEQDLECHIDQLVEIAERALSPGINDPFTVAQCIDRLGEGLVAFAHARFPTEQRYDAAGQLRVVTAPVPTFAELVAAAFDPIRQYGRASVPVCLHLLHALGLIASQFVSDEQRLAIRRQIMLLDDAARVGLLVEADRAHVHRHALHTLALLDDQERFYHQRSTG
jgi:uncharacterized membrane protein